MASVELRNLCKGYIDNNRAIKNMNLLIKDKEMVCIVGAQGCGKTSIIKVIAGIERVNSGEVFIDERFCNNLDFSYRDVALVLPNYTLYPNMSVYDNIAFTLKMQRIDAQTIKSKVEYVSDVLGLSHIMDRKPNAISTIQKYKVILGRAIVKEPKVFLFDDPFINADSNIRATLLDDLVKIHQKLGATFIYTTSFIEDAMKIADRIAVINNGAVVQMATPQELLDNPKNQFVSELLEGSKMNFINAKLVKAKDGYELLFDKVKISVPSDKGIDVEENESVIVGIYADDIRLNDVSSQGDVIDLKVDGLFKYAEEEYLVAFIGDDKVFIKKPEDINVAEGDKISVCINPQRLHIFNKCTGNSILYKD